MKKAALVGVSGFGQVHERALKALEAKGIARLCAACETDRVRAAGQIALLEGRGIPCFESFDALLAAKPELDMILIAAPHHYHRDMSIRSMEAGWHVLLEKPPAVTIQDFNEICDAASRTGRLCQINFPNTSHTHLRRLRGLIREGELGSLRHITGQGIWKRPLRYYARNSWAGHLIQNGTLVLDGPTMNALAHILHLNTLLALDGGAGSLASVQAELYHANAIQGDDTSCLRAVTDNGITLHSYVTQCHTSDLTPCLRVEGDLCTASWDYRDILTLSYSNGREVTMAAGPLDGGEPVRRMIHSLARAIDEGPQALFCPLADTALFMRAANGAFESTGRIHPIPAPYAQAFGEGEERYVAVDGIDALIARAAEKGLLFSEAGAPWGVPTPVFDAVGFEKLMWRP